MSMDQISGVILVGVGVWVLADYKRLTKMVAEAQSKYLSRGRLISEFKVKIYRTYVIVTGLIFAGIGVFALIRSILDT